ncbi:GNAT family N-acetyltransferase [Sphingomonas sp. R647]|uniref:GNAT family N-acetyltransferase n=1 Tax=Sphingomonas sp. R647 TaxID=2875233 RepID=UPI001CD64F31|nr:GNAT family N-acetyltransferase [Sphingomonas sp. R647]MCA1196879.1 GNAT family N-acetyltransferase [Sphingomonas sp. R647]
MIETERLVLRPPVAADHPALYAMWADPMVMADLGPVKDDAASAATLVRHDGYRADGLGFLSVVRKEDGAVLGFCGLKRGDPPNPIAGQVEAGWMLGRDYWRRGYALEAMRAVLDWTWANLDAPHIVAITAARNAASRAMMERLGMAYVAGGDFDHHAFAADDPLRHIVTYRITRPVSTA